MRWRFGVTPENIRRMEMVPIGVLCPYTVARPGAPAGAARGTAAPAGPPKARLGGPCGRYSERGPLCLLLWCITPLPVALMAKGQREAQLAALKACPRT